MYNIGECERSLKGVRSSTGEMLFHIERLTAWVAILEENVREMFGKGV